MIKRSLLVVTLFSLFVPVAPAAEPVAGKTLAAVDESRIEALLHQMTLPEKLSLLGGDETGFNSRGIERLGIPPIRMTDGPAGTRIDEATAFPAPVNMAASWDPELEYRYGVALGEETLAKGRTCILGPCVDIGRYPLGGRNFESFGEDPFLVSRMAVAVIRGVQSKGVIATVKHFACNDQEWERNNYDVQVDERTLREIHLPAFEAAVHEGGVLALMTAYNLVNGEHCSENRHLVTDILKGDWGFSGIVMSDWVSVYSADRAAKNGLDVEMPSPVWFGDRLEKAVRDGTVPESVIDDKVRRHLRVRFAAGIFDHPAPAKDEALIRGAAHRALAEEMAEKSLVLLKNDGILPLTSKAQTSVAMIGPFAQMAPTGGGGSAYVQPWRTTSPYEGMAAALKGVSTVQSAEGIRMESVALDTIPSTALRTPDGKVPGLFAEYFDNSELQGTPVFSHIEAGVDFVLDEGRRVDSRLSANNFSIRWTGKLVPSESGEYVLGTTSDDGSRLWVDNVLVADNWGAHGPRTVANAVKLTAGKAVDVRLEFNQLGGGAAARLGWMPPSRGKPMPTIEEAVALARKSSVAVVCVGRTADWESEGVDVADFKMPANQDALVEAVAASNPNTIVVVYGGVPAAIKPWVGKVKAVVAALYPGQEGGEALAKMLLGLINPSGKLPFSYIQSREESPAFQGYGDPKLKVGYKEGVFVGYRYYDEHGVQPLFPFGFGLSYTSFEYSNLRVEKTSPHEWVARVDVRNTGAVAGDEIVQVYIAPEHSPVPRPHKELKGFARLSLKPGEARTATIALPPRAFQYFDPATGHWTSETGACAVHVGASSQDLRLHARIESP